MKRKIFALLAAAVFGVMSAGALMACEPTSTNPTEHVCGNVCPETDCGKCTSDCADPVCADKCAGHEEPTPPAPVPTEYDVIVATSIANGSVSVSAEKAAVGTEITVTAVPADGYKLKSLKYNDIDIVDNKFEMPEENVTVTAEFEPDEENWTAEEIAAVENRNLACGVSVTEGTGGIPSTYEGWIGNLANNGATVTFDVQSDENCEAGLYIKLSKRTASYTFDEAFSVTVNGVHVDCSAAMPKSDSDVWNEFEYVKVGYVSLSSERINNIVISVVSTDGNKICNMYGIKLTSYSANVAAYSEDRDWTEETEIAAISDGALNTGVYCSNGTNIDVNGNNIGNLTDEGKKLSFKVVTDEACRAVLYLNACYRNVDTRFEEAFDLNVNGVKVESFAYMPRGGTEWTEFDYIKLAFINLKTDALNKIEFVSKGGRAHNIRGIKLVTESTLLEPTANLDEHDEWNDNVCSIAAVENNGGVKTKAPGIHTSNIGGGDGWVPDIDVGSEAALGGISSHIGATVSFTVNAAEKTRAVIYIDASYRTGTYDFYEEFTLKIGNNYVFSCTTMPQNSDTSVEWTTYRKVALAVIELEAGDNEIAVSVISNEGWMGCNIQGFEIKYENADSALTLKQ